MKMKYSLWCAVILLLVSGVLQGCSGAVKMEKVKVGEITETKEWTDANGRRHIETTTIIKMRGVHKSNYRSSKGLDMSLSDLSPLPVGGASLPRYNRG